MSGTFAAIFGLFLFYPRKSVYLSLFLTDPQGRVAEFVGVDNFREILASDMFYTSFGNTRAVHRADGSDRHGGRFFWSPDAQQTQGHENIPLYLLASDGRVRRYRLDDLDDSIPPDLRHTELFPVVARRTHPMADRSEMGHDLRRAYDGLDESWIQLYPDAERHAGRVRRYLRQHQD